jgi:hypothetical protein
MGDLFGSVVGWRVVVQFRKNPNRPALIIRAKDEDKSNVVIE